MDLLARRTRSLSDAAPRGHPFHTPELGVGCALSSDYRGQGYATEAVRVLVEYAFEEVHVRRVVAPTERGNSRSVGVMRRAGVQVVTNPDTGMIYRWAVVIIENNPSQAETH